MKKIFSLITILMLCLTAGAQTNDDYDPSSPIDPGANLWNPATGELYMDLFEPGYLTQAISNLIGASEEAFMAVKKFTVVAPMTKGDLKYLVFPHCETIDLGRSSRFTVVPAEAFQYTLALKTLVLPSSVKEIEAAMPSTLELMDIYATTPPKVADNIWSGLADRKGMVVRVPASSVSAYQNAAGWKEVRIRSLEGGGGEEKEFRTVQLSVVTPDGQDVTSQVSIYWFVGSTQVGEGRTLESIEVGTTLRYRVTLSSALTLTYEQPAEGSHTVTTDGNTLCLTLTALPPAMPDQKELLGGDIDLDIVYRAAGTRRFYVPENDLRFEVLRADGETLTDFVYQASTLRFEQTSFADNEAVTVRVSSRTGLFQMAETKAEWTAANRLTATLEVKEYGITEIRCTAPKGVTAIQCMIYDLNGRKVGSCTNEGTTCTVNGLPDGTYTAILMQKSAFFARLQLLDDLNATGLRHGTDYAQMTIRQQAATTSTCSVQVPALDDTPYRHTSQEASFSAHTATVNAGFYVTLKAKVAFKEEYAPEVSNISLIVDLPEGCSYLNSSLILSHSNGSFSREGNRLVVPVEVDEVARFCVVPEQAGVCTPSALLRYTLNGKQYQQPLGMARVVVKALELEGPAISVTPDFNLSGTAAGNKRLYIYDGTQKIGETQSLSSGEWQASISLQNPLNHSHHSIYAEYENEAGGMSRTETLNLLYDPQAQAAVLSRMEMKTQSHTLIYDCLRDVLTPKYYTFNPNHNTSFTFTAKMCEDQPEKIRDPQFYVDLMDGSTSIINARYNEQEMIWTGTGSFPNADQTPTGFSFCFDYADEAGFDATELESAEAQALLDASNQMKGLLDEEYIHLDEILEESDERVTMLIHIGEDTQRFVLDYCMVNLDRTEAMIREQEETTIEMDEDSLACYTDAGEDWLRCFYLDYTTDEAWYIMLSTQEQFAKAPMRRDMNLIAGASALLKGGDIMGKVIKGYKTLKHLKKEAKEFVDDKKDLMFAKVYRDEMIALRDQYAANLSNQIWACETALGAFCPDGKSKIREAVLPAYQSFLRSYAKDAEDFLALFDGYISAYTQALACRCGAEYLSAIATFAGGKLATGAAVKSRHVIRNVSRWAPHFGTYKEVTKFVADGAKNGVQQMGKMLDINTDFMSTKRFIDSWAPKRYFICADHLLELLSDIRNAYQKCDEEEESQPEPQPQPKPQPKPKNRRRPQPKIINIRPIIDPSGYVYEAVPENRLEDVTATLFYSESDPGTQPEAGMLWKAEEYGQQNPLHTDGEGLYSWDVPMGYWQVRFEKEGYLPAQTDWLPVPPPQLEVNIPMVRQSTPDIAKVTAYPDAIDIVFSMYMQSASLAGFRLFQNGYSVAGREEEIPGRIEMTDEQEGVVKHIRFIPEGNNGDLKKTTVTLCIPSTVMSYAGTAMGQEWKEELEVEGHLDELIVEERIQLNVGMDGAFELWCRPAPAGIQPDITFDSDFLTLINQPVFNEEGMALVEMRGNLPGSTDLTLSIGELSVTTTIDISYDQWKTVCKPVASILSGTAVAKGTAIELICPTEGAVIYYTLDGSCPCDESASRKVYDDTSIVVDRELTIHAIAVKDGMLDSEVAEFHYTLATGIQPVEEGMVPEAFFTIAGSPALPPLKPGLYIQRTSAGTRKILIR